MTDNRRSATRHEVAIAVTALVRGRSIESSLEQRFDGTIRNLSLGGAFVHIGRRLAIGTPVSLRFEIPTHARPIEASAVVRWTSGEGVGVQFEGLRAAEVFALGKFFEGL
ncbi:MAG TPA: PilZ domain-containing protein [Kofleriaceae bacterium]|nr:PilZ domain-containing protein [Kofleriaceae bacterium]